MARREYPPDARQTSVSTPTRCSKSSGSAPRRSKRYVPAAPFRKLPCVRPRRREDAPRVSATFPSGGNMTDSRSSSGRLFVLDLSGGRVYSLNPDGSDPKTLVTGCRLPDGLTVDSAAGYIYWTNMGIPHKNDGSIERADLDGGNRRFIIPEGGTFTPKQLHLEKKSGKLYWSDREGMRVMRANLDGTQVETLIQSGEGEGDRHNPSNWCVGITVYPIRGPIYFTQTCADGSRLGRIFRASIDFPGGQHAATP